MKALSFLLALVSVAVPVNWPSEFRRHYRVGFEPHDKVKSNSATTIG